MVGPSGLDTSAVYATWLNDTTLLYAAFEDDKLVWYTFDAQTLEKTAAAPPIRHDETLWVSNGLTPPTRYPVLNGFVSPLGTYAMYVVNSQAGPPEPGKQPLPTEVWIHDTLAGSRSLLYQGHPGQVLNVAWSQDETVVAFDFGDEGDTDLYAGDPRSPSVISPTQRDMVRMASGDEWSMSPDGTLLAVVDRSFQLVLLPVSAASPMVVDRPALGPAFSEDGGTVHYWRGSLLEPEGSELWAYDIALGDSRPILTLEALQAVVAAYKSLPSVPDLGYAEGGFMGSSYAVSPSEDSIALWGGWLWILHLCE